MQNTFAATALNRLQLVCKKYPRYEGVASKDKPLGPNATLHFGQLVVICEILAGSTVSPSVPEMVQADKDEILGTLLNLQVTYQEIPDIVEILQAVIEVYEKFGAKKPAPHTG